VQQQIYSDIRKHVEIGGQKMEEAFIGWVGDALRLAREGKFRDLGRIQRLAWLRVIREATRKPGYIADLDVTGRAISDHLIRCIDSLREQRFKDLSIDLLYAWWTSDDSINALSKEFSIGRTKAYDEFKGAIELVAECLWREERQALQARHLSVQPSDYDRERKFEYVSRKDPETMQDVVQSALEMILGHKVTEFAGTGGSGKTALAAQIASRVQREGIFDFVIWCDAKTHRLEPDGMMVSTPEKSPITSFEAILTEIRKQCGERDALNPMELEEKRDLVDRMLSRQDILVIIDNTESLTSADSRALGEFLSTMPGRSRALLTGRRALPNVSAARIQVEEMLEDEVEEFISRTCDFYAYWMGLDEFGDAIRRMGIPRNPLFLLCLVAYAKKNKVPLMEAVPEVAGSDAAIKYLLGKQYEEMSAAQKSILGAAAIVGSPTPDRTLQAASGINDKQVFDAALADLCDLNLLVQQSEGQWALPSFIRSCVEQMEAVRETVPETRSRLIQYFIMALQWRDHEDRVPLVRENKETLLKVIEWAYGLNEWQALLDLIELSGNALSLLGYGAERLKAAEKAKIAALQQGNMNDYYRIWAFDVAYALLRAGRIEQAESNYNQILEEAGGRYGKAIAVAQRNLGLIELDRGNLENAETLVTSALNETPEEDKYWKAVVLKVLGYIRVRQGDYEQAADLCAEALNLLSHDGADLEERSKLHYDLALVNALMNNDVERRRHHRLGDEFAQGRDRAMAYGLQRRAEIWLAQGDTENAISTARQSWHMYRKQGDLFRIRECERILERCGERPPEENTVQY
jgi:tetratricopeptide (TPR) repeat protein